jgi:hypothetical protein
MTMEFEDLPALWRARKGTPDAAAPFDRLAQIEERSRRLDALVRRRDRLETAVALTIAPFFAAVVVWGTHGVGRLGAALLTLSCLWIPLRLAHARRSFGAAPRDRSLKSFLHEERARVQAQVRLLRTIIWWYLLPLGVGVVLLFSGARSLVATTVYAAFVAALYGGIYALNRRAVATELEPRLEEIGALLAAVDDESADHASDSRSP